MRERESESEIEREREREREIESEKRGEVRKGKQKGQQRRDREPCFCEASPACCFRVPFPSGMGQVIFISHEWLATHHPDPDGEQLKAPWIYFKGALQLPIQRSPMTPFKGALEFPLKLRSGVDEMGVSTAVDDRNPASLHIQKHT